MKGLANQITGLINQRLLSSPYGTVAISSEPLFSKALCSSSCFWCSCLCASLHQHFQMCAHACARAYTYVLFSFLSKPIRAHLYSACSARLHTRGGLLTIFIWEIGRRWKDRWREGGQTRWQQDIQLVWTGETRKEEKKEKRNKERGEEKERERRTGVE